MEETSSEESSLEEPQGQVLSQTEKAFLSFLVNVVRTILKLPIVLYSKVKGFGLRHPPQHPQSFCVHPYLKSLDSGENKYLVLRVSLTQDQCLVLQAHVGFIH